MTDPTAAGTNIPGEETHLTGGEEGSEKTVTDREGRAIGICPYRIADFEALVEMYAAFDPAERAQGLPPLSECAIESWLDSVVSAGIDVLACHEGRPVGHASLVPDDDRHELVIFVVGDYQEAGIGARLLRRLLERARIAGVNRVWLTVERGNVIARNLYESAGFEVLDRPTRSGSIPRVLEMELPLSD